MQVNFFKNNYHTPAVIVIEVVKNKTSSSYSLYYINYLSVSYHAAYSAQQSSLSKHYCLNCYFCFQNILCLLYNTTYMADIFSEIRQVLGKSGQNDTWQVLLTCCVLN